MTRHNNAGLRKLCEHSTTAAIYARKSTEQQGVADEVKSVTRQVDNARAFAATKGWTVDDAHVFVDDGKSGAEFERRPGLQRLLRLLEPRPPFSVLIVSDEPYRERRRANDVS